MIKYSEGDLQADSTQQLWTFTIQDIIHRSAFPLRRKVSDTKYCDLNKR
jgi:hypothetical protein